MELNPQKSTSLNSTCCCSRDTIELCVKAMKAFMFAEAVHI